MKEAARPPGPLPGVLTASGRFLCPHTAEGMQKHVRWSDSHVLRDESPDLQELPEGKQAACGSGQQWHWGPMPQCGAHGTVSSASLFLGRFSHLRSNPTSLSVKGEPRASGKRIVGADALPTSASRAGGLGAGRLGPQHRSEAGGFGDHGRGRPGWQLHGGSFACESRGLPLGAPGARTVSLRSATARRSHPGPSAAASTLAAGRVSDRTPQCGGPGRSPRAQRHLDRPGNGETRQRMEGWAEPGTSPPHGGLPRC